VADDEQEPTPGSERALEQEPSEKDEPGTMPPLEPGTMPPEDDEPDRG
jgi:hypothetical protein